MLSLPTLRCSRRVPPANVNSQPYPMPSDLKQVTDVRSCAASFNVATPGHGYVVGQELTVSPLNNDTYKCVVFEIRMCLACVCFLMLILSLCLLLASLTLYLHTHVHLFILHHFVSRRFKTRARVVRVDDAGGIQALDVRPPTLKIYPYALRNEREMSFVYFYFQVVLPAPEEFDGAVIEGQQFVVTASGGNEQNSARVTIEREPTGHLFTRGLEMISKGNRFVRVEGEYIAQAVDVDRGYLKTSVSMERPPVIRICCGPADWVSSLQVVKLGCCDVGYHGVPFLAKALRTLPLTTLHLRENVCIGSNFGCLAGTTPPPPPAPPLTPSPRFCCSIAFTSSFAV